MKKKLLFIFLLFFSLSTLWAQSNTPFITKWKEGNVYYQLHGAISYSLIDSSTNAVVVSGNVTNNSISITTGLNATSTYYLHIVFDNNATQRRFYTTDSSHLTNLREVIDWGNTQWTSMQDAFNYAINLTSVPSIPPDLSLVSNFSYMFYYATAFNSDLSNWNVSNGTNFSYMFAYATAFNSDLSNWNVSNGTNFNSMFAYATAFNSDLSNWNVSNGTNFSNMFNGARAFNSDLSNWNVSNGTGFSYMFFQARAFNSDLSNWNVSNGTNFSYMFYYATAFNSDLSNWNVSNGTNFSGMFAYTSAFNSDLSNWNVSNGTNFSNMFINARAFNSDLSNWNVSNGTNFSYMFYYATAFNSDLSSWNLSSVTSASGLYYMLSGSGIDCYNLSNTIIGWANNTNTPNGKTNFNLAGLSYNAAANTAFNNVLKAPTANGGKGWSGTNGTVVPDAQCMPAPTPFITKWKGGNIYYPVQGAVSYSVIDSSTNAVVTSGNVSNNLISITTGLNAASTYYLHIAFDNNATNRRFYSTTSSYLNNLREVIQWGNTKWTSMVQAFYNAINLTSIPSTPPDLSLVSNFTSMFYGARAFNSDLSNWIVSNGTNFSGMFYGARAFNSDLSNWNVSNGTGFFYMFYGARAFNSDLSNWNVSNGTDFSLMFYNASAFNSDLSNWNVSNGTNFANMFNGASAFNSDLSSWNLSSVTSTSGLNSMLLNSGIDCYNLSNTIIGWANNPNTPINQTNFNLAGLSYNAAADSVFNNVLKAPTANGGKGWTGTNGTVVPDASCVSTALPLQLLTFNVYKNEDNTADIKWEIIEDEEVKLYTIEHSTPNTSWASLASIVPNATTNHTQAYTYTHTHPTAGTNIYRLKITDVWGKTTYSKIGAVTFDTKNSTLIYPNPTSSFVNIISSKEQMKVIALYNTIGQKAYEESIDATEYTIDLNHLSDGVYFLKVTYADGNTLIERIVKQ